MASATFDRIGEWPAPSAGIDILGHLDLCRVEVGRRLDQDRRAMLGQFLTPAPVARLMASMMTVEPQQHVHLLDPGAGIGTLFSACIEVWCAQQAPPAQITVVAYEIEPAFLNYLEVAASLCRKACEEKGVRFEIDIRVDDFIARAADCLRPRLFSSVSPEQFSHAILNPPYRKIQSASNTRKILSSCGVETSNLYTAFMALSSMLLLPDGQQVSITPRSFCNGLYFKPFRQAFLRSMQIERLHLFHSRSEAFKEDDVLQENIIMSARKVEHSNGPVIVSSSYGTDDGIFAREVERSEVISTGDDAFIHIVADDLDNRVAGLAGKFEMTLGDLGIQVSTGRVVDFRATEFIQQSPTSETVPLIYPVNLVRGFVEWPILNGRKPQAIVSNHKSAELLVPSDYYVLVKRFSSKEERRRVVAAVVDPGRIPGAYLGFENHLNYYHRNHEGLPRALAIGLAGFLNSTIVDTYFRQFSGHTQVNAADLRSLRYPRLEELEALGNLIGDEFPAQEELDRLVERELLGMTAEDATNNPVAAKIKINQALDVLKALGLPRAQQNERSALTLLALLNLKPGTPWKNAAAPLVGITPIMEFFSRYYGKTYAPNTRETVRRQTIHQFLDAGLILINPDQPNRPTNSPKAVYQVEQGMLDLVRAYGSTEWNKRLRAHLASLATLRERYAREREMKRIPIEISPGNTLLLSPGGQNILVKSIIDEFAPRYTPGGSLVYVGDTDSKFAYFDEPLLTKLGVTIEAHGKMPDVIIYYTERNWLVLIEAVTSHGPVNRKRREELKRLFENSTAGLVFVSAFLTRKAMMEFLNDISWETEVWVAESPSHLIHFNGERFLGPYER